MTTIAVRQINAFDAYNDNVVSFAYNGNQCIKNKIIIYDSSNNSVAYENIVETFSLSHIIPKNTLINGKSYYCTITAYYKNDQIEGSVTSGASNVFLCLDTPTWRFNGIEDGDIIGNSYYTFSVDYFQKQNETIDEYQIIIYSASDTVVWRSDSIYDLNSPQTVDSLNNNTLYYIRALGVTTHGITLDTRDKDTGKDISINVKYATPDTYALAYLDNNKWQGWINVSTNVASIEGRSVTGNPISYVENLDDISADLTHGDGVVFDENFLIKDNFTLILKVYNAINNSIILTSNIGFSVSIHAASIRDFADNGANDFIFATLKTGDYVINSNYIENPDSGTETIRRLLYIVVQRINGLYNLKLMRPQF